MSVYTCGMGDPLDMLVEEASEIIKAVMKHRRFAGTDAHRNPETGQTATEQIIAEIGDLQAVIEIITDNRLLGITEEALITAKADKFCRLKENFGYDHE